MLARKKNAYQGMAATVVAVLGLTAEEIDGEARKILNIQTVHSSVREDRRLDPEASRKTDEAEYPNIHPDINTTKVIDTRSSSEASNEKPVKRRLEGVNLRKQVPSNTKK